MTKISIRRAGIVLVGLTILAMPLSATAVDLLGGKVAKFKDATGTSKDLAKVVFAKDLGLDGALPDPTTESSSVRITSDTVDTGVVLLDPAFWEAAGSSGFQYKDKTGASAGILKILLKSSATGGKLIVVAKGDNYGATAITGPAAFVQVRLQIGDSTSYCGNFENPPSTVVKNEEGLVIFKGPSAPCDCFETDADACNGNGTPDGTCTGNCLCDGIWTGTACDTCPETDVDTCNSNGRPDGTCTGNCLCDGNWTGAACDLEPLTVYTAGGADLGAPNRNDGQLGRIVANNYCIAAKPPELNCSQTLGLVSLFGGSTNDSPPIIWGDSIINFPGFWGVPADRKIQGRHGLKLADDWSDFTDGTWDAGSYGNDSVVGGNDPFRQWYYTFSYANGSYAIEGSCGVTITPGVKSVGFTATSGNEELYGFSGGYTISGDTCSDPDGGFRTAIFALFCLCQP